MGAVLSATGQILGGNAQKNADDFNATISRQNATADIDNASADAMVQERQTTQALGKTKATYAAAGVDMTGSPLEVLASQAANGELARQTIMYRGTLAANQQLSQATLDEYQGSNAQTAGYIAAGSTILTAAARGVAGGMG